MPKLRASDARTMLHRGRALIERARTRPAAPAGEGQEAELAGTLARLDERLTRLESVVEGLQDAMHRESVRRDQEAADLSRRTEPSEIARALSDDARRRGL